MYRLLTLTFTFAVLVSLAPPAPAAAADGAPARLKARVTVTDEVVRLGDLFDGLATGHETVLGNAPAPGQSVTVDARWLDAVARAYGVAWRPVSALQTAVVVRASETIGVRRIEAALRDALAAHGVARDALIALDTPNLTLHVPVGMDTGLTVERLAFDPASARFSADIAVPGKGAPVARAAVSGHAAAMVDVPVVNRRIERGTVIRARDVAWSRERASRINRTIARGAEQLIGKSPRRPLRPGEPIAANDLRAPVTVAKNTLVTIRLATDQMVLTAQGRALDDGATGDVIRVMNTKSHAVIDAAVVGSGLVQVTPDGPARTLAEIRR